MKLTPGQVVWYVPNYGSTHSRNLTITKVGRKWAETEDRHLRIELGTTDVHETNYGLRGTVYESKELWERAARLQAAWDDLRLDTYRRRWRPAHMTLEAIVEVRRLLGLEVLDG